MANASNNTTGYTGAKAGGTVAAKGTQTRNSPNVNYHVGQAAKQVAGSVLNLKHASLAFVPLTPQQRNTALLGKPHGAKTVWGSIATLAQQVAAQQGNNGQCTVALLACALCGYYSQGTGIAKPNKAQQAAYSAGAALAKQHGQLANCTYVGAPSGAFYGWLAKTLTQANLLVTTATGKRFAIGKPAQQ